MQRNLIAIRDVLLHIERRMPFTGNLRQLIPAEIVSEASEEELRYAIYLILDRGYLDGVWDPKSHEPNFPLVRAITNLGHEFLELSRDPEIQTELLRLMKETGVRSIEALKPIAKNLVEAKLAAVAGTKAA